MCSIWIIKVWNVNSFLDAAADAAGGGYIALFPAVQPQVVGMENISPAVGLLYATNLVGYLFGTPIASALINKSTPPNYMNGAIWAGVTVIVGSLFAGWLRVAQGGWKWARI